MIFNLYYPFTPPAEQNGDAERASPNTPLGCAFGRAVRDVPGCQTLASGPRWEPARCGRGPARLLRPLPKRGPAGAAQPGGAARGRCHHAPGPRAAASAGPVRAWRGPGGAAAAEGPWLVWEAPGWRCGGTRRVLSPLLQSIPQV